ncbi:MAG: hypothetical protein HKN47_15215 [Pirellulaceae bacterium]|nr:hypothetical protein [Pirellulaceae bacterium]
MKHCTHRVVIACVVLIVAMRSSSVLAKDFSISLGSDVEPIVAGVAAGDSLVVSNGTWKNAELKFERRSGTADAPIHIRAESAGKVVFTGRSLLRLSGTHVIVSGFVFRDISGVSDVVELRSHSERHSHNCRLTDCVFAQTPDSQIGNDSRWFSVYGTRNRIDH